MAAPAPQPTNGCDAAHTPHIVLLTVPLPGHYIPFSNLAHLLAAAGVKVTCFSTGHVFEKLQHAVGSDREGTAKNSIPVRFQALVEDVPTVTEANVSQWLQRGNDEEMKEMLERAIEQLTPAPCCIVTDLFVLWAQDVAEKLNIPWHTFYTASATVLDFMLMVPDLIKQGKLPISSTKINDGYIDLPGRPPIPTDDILEPLRSENHKRFHYLVNVCERLRESPCILVNTFEELEGDSLTSSITNANSKGPEILPIGPILPDLIGRCNENHLINPLHKREELSEAEKWLDTQAAQSVVYISFGSMATITKEEVRELALGLEATCRPFLWLFCPPGVPQISTTNESIAPNAEDLFPPGFEDRIKGRGILINRWAPQLKILAHQATGAFLSHCGWNSTLESVCAGVPMLTWPIKADQKMNSRFLVDVAGVGFRFKKSSDGIVEHTEITNVVNQMMDAEEGKLARNKIRELQVAAKNAMTTTGLSRSNLEGYVKKCSTSLCKSTSTRPSFIQYDTVCCPMIAKTNP